MLASLKPFARTDKRPAARGRITDPDAFGIEVEGDARIAGIAEGDVLIASPAAAVAAGDVVLVLAEGIGGKRWSVRRASLVKGQTVYAHDRQLAGWMASVETVLMVAKVVEVRRDGKAFAPRALRPAEMKEARAQALERADLARFGGQWLDDRKH